MNDLPVLVVHGALIAKLLVAGAALGWFGVVVLVRRRIERTKLSYAVGGRLDALTGLAPGYASLRGTLRGTACTLCDNDGLLHDIGYAHSDGLYVEAAGERIALAGDVQVIRGTRAAAHWRRPPAATPAGLARDRGRGRWRLFSIADGDDVVIQGVLARTPGEPGDHREDPTGWTMRPMSNLPAIELVAARPVTVPVPLGPIRAAVWAVVALVASYATLYEVGKQLVERDHKSPAFGLRLQLAAALPGSRAEAISDLWWHQRDRPHTREMLAQDLALVELEQGCAGRAAWLVEHERYEDVLATARGCDPDAEAHALARLGRYPEAAALLAQHPEALHDQLRERVVIELGAGRWQDAAVAAERVADDLDHEAAVTPMYASINQPRSVQARCLAEWFRHKAGDAVAGARLAQLAITTGAAACALPAALQLPAEQRPLALATVLDKDRYGDHGRLAEALLWLDAGRDDNVDLGARFVRSGIDPWTWLAPLAIDGTTDGAADRDAAKRLDSLHGRRALHAMLFGDLATARSEASAIAGDVRDAIVAAIELHTAKFPIAWTSSHYAGLDLGNALATRNGQPRDKPFVIDGCDKAIDAALPAAIAGDGLALATAITSCDQSAGIVEPLIGVAPRITTHRAELGDALDHYSSRSYARDPLPFEYVNQAAFRRDLLRLAGATAAADRWQARIAAQAEVLADRDRLIGLLLWEL
ncbi:MAG TPA: hypothetical protein VH165_35960 [Kofleriaceae bacterium]|nr:hypothetical protein [Kofleriaceae bacterium]